MSGDELFRLLVENVEDYAIFVMDPAAKVVAWNAGAERILGYSADEILGREGAVIFTPEDRARNAPQREIAEALRAGRAEDERWHIRKDGSRFYASGILTPLYEPDGTLRGFAKILRDFTNRKLTEERLREAQKLESIAVLAGGVAHDFNNILTGILGHASLAEEMLPEQSPVRRLIDEVIQSAERAADLTKQMLAYAGKGRVIVEPVDLSALVRSMRPILAPALPSSVHLELNLADRVPTISADPKQIEQVVLNLVLNAGEAIPGAGTVQVATYGNRDDAVLEVSDTGHGMPPEVRARAFEPFFSTKFTGRGLGLAAVAGIVRAHHGEIEVESAPGKGSRFRILLPAAVVQL